MTIVPRNPDFVYIATMGDGQSGSTPCTLHQPAGPTRISVAGPGSKLLQQALMMPSGPSQLRLQHFTMGRAISGTILLVLGIPALGAGGWLVDRGLTEFWQGSPDFPIPLGVGSFVLAHGVVFTLVGIIQLATIKTNSVRLISLGSSTALNAPRLRLTAGGIAPTADRAGAMAGLTFSY